MQFIPWGDVVIEITTHGLMMGAYLGHYSIVMHVLYYTCTL